jgi:hypothetical protein
MTKTIIGYPRIGEHRELKFATQKYFKHQITQAELQTTAQQLRAKNWTPFNKQASIRFQLATFHSLIPR